MWLDVDVSRRQGQHGMTLSLVVGQLWGGCPMEVLTKGEVVRPGDMGRSIPPAASLPQDLLWNKSHFLSLSHLSGSLERWLFARTTSEQSLSTFDEKAPFYFLQSMSFPVFKIGFLIGHHITI